MYIYEYFQFVWQNLVTLQHWKMLADKKRNKLLIASIKFIKRLYFACVFWLYNPFKKFLETDFFPQNSCQILPDTPTHQNPHLLFLIRIQTDI